MTWLKVDDTFWSHPKVIECSPRAIALWVLAGSWSAQQLTGGEIPSSAIGMLRAAPRDAAELVTAGLWLETDDGYAFHDWDEYQPSAAAERARRSELSAVRSAAGRKGAEARWGYGNPDGNPTGKRHGKPVASAWQADGPVPVPVPRERSSDLSQARERFDEFYAAYPRKVGKAAARKAFEKAAKSGVDVEVIIAGAAEFAADPNLPTDRNFIPHPATWLNQGRWDDEPLPARLERADEHQASGLALVGDIRREEAAAWEAARLDWLDTLELTMDEYRERYEEPGWLDAMQHEYKARKARQVESTA